MSDVAKQEFNRVVKGNNFMTPRIEGHYHIKDGVVELSWGEGMFSPDLYGVTVVAKGERDFERSTCFNSRGEAMRYIQSMQ